MSKSAELAINKQESRDEYTPPCLQALGAKYDPGFHFEPEGHKYTFNGKEMTGTTTILKGIKNPDRLLSWAVDCAVDAMVAGKPEKEARKAHILSRDIRRDDGVNTHALVERYIRELIRSNGGRADRLDGDSSIKPFQEWAIKEEVRFLGSEVPVYYLEGFVGGIIDFLFEKDGKVYVGDLKTNKRPRSGSGIYYSYWMQIASYRNAIESMGGKVDGQYIVRMSTDFEAKWRDAYKEDRAAFLGALAIYRATNNYENKYR